MNIYNRCGCTSEDCRVNGCLTQRQRNETGGVRVQAIEQERADFEAWAADIAELHTMPSGEYSSRITRFAWEAYQAGRATLKPQKPEPNDVMLSGVLRMPFNMAMATEMSRVQFYHRAQQALDELEALQSQDREDAERFRWLTEDHADAATRTRCREILDRMAVMSYSAAVTDIDHARRIEGET